MSFIEVIYEKDRVNLFLNRSEKRNALNKDFINELFQVINKLEKDPACRLVVIQSKVPGTFCSGVDLNELISFETIEDARSFALLFDETMIRLLKFSKPIIAVIDGIAFGGGFAIASAADLRIITQNGRISFPAGKLGAVLPPALTFMLNALVGIGISRDLLTTGRVIKAEEAFRLRLVNRFIQPEEVRKVLNKEIRSILKSSDTSLQLTRRITNQQLLVEIEKYNLTGAENFAFLAATKEWQTRINKFLQSN